MQAGQFAIYETRVSDGSRLPRSADRPPTAPAGGTPKKQ